MPVEIIKPGTHIDFLSKWRICVALSLALLAAGLIGVATRGVQLGIDFAGGTEVQIRFHEGVTADEGLIRRVVSGLEIEGASVIRYGKPEENEFLIKFPGERRIDHEEESQEGTLAATNDRIIALDEALTGEIGPHDRQRVEFVGPKVGAELREDGLRAMGIACVLILIYIAFRFSARFAPGAVVALLHDVLITCSIWVLFGLEFDLRVLAALLAIMGYSLNDTIIVYDRVRENMELRTKHDLKELLNLSVNQTLSRTLLTSITTLAAVLCLLVLGGDVVRPFALAMAIGVLIGTYSSIYIASPTLLWLETRLAGGAGGRAPAQEAKKQKPKGKKKGRGKSAKAAL
ncbi:MAG: protein translocase subunit SecF [Deltaproteobacteria bacterium]|nr:protein translocase subunit SecF [Deltaproteobacteria bacterium]